MKGRFTIRPRFEANIAQFCAQLQVIVNLAVSNQRGALFLMDRLHSRSQVYDRQACAYEASPTGNIPAASVGPAVGECGFQSIENCRIRSATVARHQSRNPT